MPTVQATVTVSTNPEGMTLEAHIAEAGQQTGRQLLVRMCHY